MEIGGIETGYVDEAFERRKRQAEAGLKLAFLNRHDPLVEDYERLGTRQDLTRAEIDAWLETRRQAYRRATGVEIEQRDILAAGLRQIAETGDHSVDELIADLRRNYVNGCSSLGGCSEESGWGLSF